jgi:uncharacterized NAD(P)/FAD-binding protein YdhS
MTARNLEADECRHKGKIVSYVHDVYPIPEKIDHINGGESVYIIGMGLTAVDLVRAFTVGRGGTFEKGRYIKTGREPLVILGSRLGLPYCARSFNQKDSQYQPAILTHEAVKKLKLQKKNDSIFKRIYFRYYGRKWNMCIIRSCSETISVLNI